MNKRWIWIGAGVAVIAVLGIGFVTMRDDAAYAHIATGYAAKQTCSCLHVSGRTMESCVADFPEEARSNITVTAEENNVSASVLFGAISAEAVYEEGYGCRLLD
jgi:hypothetical protein